VVLNKNSWVAIFASKQLKSPIASWCVLH